jgi:3-deoxy-D-arabino-heptulosonate 7-phosphate (DAHP) synthase class II
MGSHPSGVHLEMMGEDVTECVGGFEQLNENWLHRAKWRRSITDSVGCRTSCQDCQYLLHLTQQLDLNDT